MCDDTLEELEEEYNDDDDNIESMSMFSMESCTTT